MDRLPYLLTLSPQVLLHEYVIHEVLWQGAWGVIYKAWHKKLEEWLVVKEFFPLCLAERSGDLVLPREGYYSQFKKEKARFLEEAKASMPLRHNNIVRSRDFFEANNTEYYVIDYENGWVLEELLRSKEKQGESYTESQLKHILCPIVEGLMYLHENSLTHGSLKPDHILIRRATEEAVLLNCTKAQHQLHEVHDTAPYFCFYESMERVEIGKVTPLVDIYALGAIMYRMVVKRTDANAAKRIISLAREGVDPLESAAIVCEGLYSLEFLQLIDECLALDEKKRPQSMEEIKNRLMCSG